MAAATARRRRGGGERSGPRLQTGPAQPGAQPQSCPRWGREPERPGPHGEERTTGRPLWLLPGRGTRGPRPRGRESGHPGGPGTEQAAAWRRCPHRGLERAKPSGSEPRVRSPGPSEGCTIAELGRALRGCSGPGLRRTLRHPPPRSPFRQLGDLGRRARPRG